MISLCSLRYKGLYDLVLGVWRTEVLSECIDYRSTCVIFLTGDRVGVNLKSGGEVLGRHGWTKR